MKKMYHLKTGLHEIPQPWVIPGIKLQRNISCYKYIIDMVCKHYKQEEKAVMSKSRKLELRIPRQIIHTLIADNFYKLSLVKIGHRCGGRDHATVLHSTRTIHDYAETDREFRAVFDRFKGIVKIRKDLFTQEYGERIYRKHGRQNK